MTKTWEEGSAHGRFQPFHNDHLDYVLAAKQRCEFLWVGITRFDTSAGTFRPLGRQRERPEANPLNYYERISIIREALLDVRVPPRAFGFVPFPIEMPRSLVTFLPKRVPCFTTICEDWNREKIRVLTEEGYEVVVLWEREKRVSGSEIRRLVASGDNSWKKMVPMATVRAIENLDLAERLNRLGRE